MELELLLGAAMEPVEPVCELLSGVLLVLPLEDADGLLCVAVGFAPLVVEELAAAGLSVLEAVPGVVLVDDCDCED
jgi:hypothetical protein